MGTHKATTFFVSVALYSITQNYIYLLNHSLFLSTEVSASRFLLQAILQHNTEKAHTWAQVSRLVC